MGGVAGGSQRPLACPEGGRDDGQRFLPLKPARIIRRGSCDFRFNLHVRIWSGVTQRLRIPNSAGLRSSVDEKPQSSERLETLRYPAARFLPEPDFRAGWAGWRRAELCDSPFQAYPRYSSSMPIPVATSIPANCSLSPTVYLRVRSMGGWANRASRFPEKTGTV